MFNEDEKEEIVKGISFGWTIFAIIAVLALITFTLLGGFGRIIGREFQKFDEETRTQVMEESRTYNEGMAQNLDKLCLEWGRGGNVAVARSIRHRSSGYKGVLPPHVQQCVDAARKAQ